MSRSRGRGRSTLHDLLDAAGPGRHDDHAVGEEDRLGNRVGDEHDGLPRLPPDAQQLEVHELARHGVERAEGLVHQEQRRVVDERAGDGHALAHAARQLVRVLVLEALEADQLEQRHRPRARGPCRRAAAPPRASRTLSRTVRQGRSTGILEDDADVAARPVDGLAAQAHGARRARDEPGEDLHEGGLAAARLSDDGDELARGDVEGDAAERVNQRATSGDVGLFQIRYADERSATHAGDGPWNAQVSEPGARRVKDKLRYTLAL